MSTQAITTSTPRLALRLPAQSLALVFGALLAGCDDGQKTVVDVPRDVVAIIPDDGNHAPVLYKVGARVVEVGKPLSLLLQAVDADGDTLTFSIQGDKPGGSAVDPNSGTFSFSPQAGTEGTVPKLTFVVSDGKATDTMEVSIYVLAPGQNRPPQFAPLANQVAEVNKKYTLTLQATDPEGDPLSFGAVGQLPAGAAFDPGERRFTWTPGAEDGGTTAAVTFSVNDGHYNILTEVQIDVLDPNYVAGKCVDDVNEPNNVVGQATPLSVGDYEKLSLCDTPQSPVDVDWYSISLNTGQTLSLTLDFEHAVGDLDMALYFKGQTAAAIALADGATNQEFLVYTATAPEDLLLKVFGTGQAAFQSPYSLTVSTAGLACQDDMLEPNDSKLQPVGVNADGSHSLMFCPGNLDFFEIELSCGQLLTAELNYTAANGSLDVWLYRDAKSSSPAAVSATVGAVEALIYEAPKDEAVLLLVRGDPPEATLNAYTLVTESSPPSSCSDDTREPNNTRASATPLKPPSDSAKSLSLCCNEDWFFVPLALGDGALFAVNFAKGLDVTAEVYTVDDDEPIAVGEPDADGLVVTLDGAPFSGSFYLRVEGTPGTAYSVDLLTFENEGCTSSKACPVDKVCWLSKGACVDAFCYDEFDCPAGQDMPCIQNHCLPGCTYDADCKLGNACKGFAEGTYCGAQGVLGTGAECTSFAECKGQAACAFPTKGGYCSKLGCVANPECGNDGSCVQLSTGDTLCAQKCVSNGDCRVGAGYTCQPKTLPNGLPTNVCLPTSL